MDPPKERIALCFYGQPRGFEENYNNIHTFITDNCKNYQVDIFIHTWWDHSVIGQSYPCAPWSKTPESQRLIKADTIDTIKQLYNPVRILYEKPNLFENEVQTVKTMELYHNITEVRKTQNVSNILSNIYSKYKVSQLLERYVEHTKYTYKAVVSLRFDVNSGLKLFNPDACLPNKVYQFYRNELILPPQRTYILDILVVFTDIHCFFNYSKAYTNVQTINNSQECKQAAANFGLNFEINAEEIVTFNLRLYYSEDEIKNSFIYLY
jgi:hypothetical protein